MFFSGYTTDRQLLADQSLATNRMRRDFLTGLYDGNAGVTGDGLIPGRFPHTSLRFASGALGGTWDFAPQRAGDFAAQSRYVEKNPLLRG